MKTSSLESSKELLLQLRAGEVSFEKVLVKVRPVLEGRAMWFMERIRQTLHTQADLVRIGEFTVWRAVDKWDPQKTANIVRYVDVQIARSMEKALLVAAGRPDPRRSSPATQVYAADLERVRYSNQGEKRVRADGGRLFEKLLAATQPEVLNQEQVLIRIEEGTQGLEALFSKHTEGLHRRLLEMVVQKGYTVDDAAVAMFSSMRLRRVYRLKSPDHARKVAHAVVVRMRRSLEGERVSEASV